MSDKDNRSDNLVRILRGQVKPREPSVQIEIIAGRDVNIGAGAAGRASPPGSTRKKPGRYRESLLKLIDERARALRLEPEQVRDLAARRLGRIVASLDELVEIDLARLYAILSELKRPALD